MVSNDATTPAFHRRTNRQKIAVTSVENEGQSLMRDSEEARSSRHAAA